MIIKNCWISQSETSPRTIDNVVNIIRCWLAVIKMSRHQYFRLLLDYWDICIYPNEWTMSCVRMRPNYFVIVLLPTWPIKKVTRLLTMSAVYLWRYFPAEKYGSIQIDKLIKKEWLKRFNRFKDQNTRWDSIYRYISVSAWGDCHFNNRCDDWEVPKDCLVRGRQDWHPIQIGSMYQHMEYEWAAVSRWWDQQALSSAGRQALALKLYTAPYYYVWSVQSHLISAVRNNAIWCLGMCSFSIWILCC